MKTTPNLIILAISSLWLVISSAALVDHDGWEFYGDRKKSAKHGLHSATRDAAPLDRNGGVRFDKEMQSRPEMHVTNDELLKAPERSSSSLNLRPIAKMENVKAEPPLSPDRYSVLNFDKMPDDIQHGERYLANVESSWWGRLYIEGFPAPIQYFRAHFGLPPPNGTVRLMLASPLNMCDDVTGLAILNNITQLDTETVIVAMRGLCNFGEKANVAHDSGAGGILFINNVEGNFHPSGPEARDTPISAAMIGRDDGSQLIHALNILQQENNEDKLVWGRYVPIQCGRSVSTTYCGPVSQEDDAFVSSLKYEGVISMDDQEFEYMQGEFGSWIDPMREWTILVPSVIGSDAHCCESFGFEDSISIDNALLCIRGYCDFVTKADNAAKAGAGMLIVSSHNNTIYRMGVDPPERARNLSVATAMVSADTYEIMVDAYFSNLDDGLTSPTFRIIQSSFSLDTCRKIAQVVK